MTIKLIIYDLDGTLLDAFGDITACMNQGLAACDLPPYDIETVKTFVGHGVDVAIERALAKHGLEHFDRVREVMAKCYASPKFQKGTCYPGALEVLDAMRARGFKQAVLTNKPEPIALKSCDRVGISERVDLVIGARDGVALKPSPEMLEVVERETGIPRTSAVMIGDGDADGGLARATGLPFIGCTWGTLTAEALKQFNPIALIDSIDALPSALKKIQENS